MAGPIECEADPDLNFRFCRSLVDALAASEEFGRVHPRILVAHVRRDVERDGKAARGWESEIHRVSLVYDVSAQTGGLMRGAVLVYWCGQGIELFRKESRGAA